MIVFRDLIIVMISTAAGFCFGCAYQLWLAYKKQKNQLPIMRCNKCGSIRSDDVFSDGGVCDYFINDKVCGGIWHEAVGGHAGPLLELSKIED